MPLTNEAVRTRTETMLQSLQNTICQSLETIDGTNFHEEIWTRAGGGGGITRVLQNGNVFEKAGVSTSTISGLLSKDAAQTAGIGNGNFTGDNIPFFITSISLIIHPHNPFVPSTHAHYRYSEQGDSTTPGSWSFSGSADLTPYYLFEEDAINFHRLHKEACDRYNPAFYPRFKQACDEYFYLPHRKEHRGIGGIFLGNLNEYDSDMLYALTTSCATAFLPAYLPIVERRKDLPFTEQHQRWQRQRRGRYVEFNLTYDRGTAFGLKTGGRVESILMSLPPVAGWEYDYHPEASSEEARLMEVLQKPRQWV
ncbi:MAG: oxygen-dependent coproporphyrinogen oxidase [Ktedonobacteraceae bacterium]|nr:oxygen-dependent coproporphyrinogen oxidase [Ktedonobacteraceae bacterium]